MTKFFSDVLIEVSRGPVLESVHRGSIAVVNSAGDLLYWAGDPRRMICMRSAAKPLQALSVVLSGAAGRFALSDRELAIMCASHYGEETHWAVIRGLLEKMGLSPEHLRCGTGPAPVALGPIFDTPAKLLEWRQAHADCSGKHCGFLASCLHLGFSVDDYDRAEHPVQRQVLSVVADMCGIPADEVLLAEDGCGVPVYGLPLFHMALGFARLGNPEKLAPDRADACRRITAAVSAAPEMLAGTDGFCTELVRHTGGKLIGKMGAEGVYGIGLVGGDAGIALKIDDGNCGRAVAPVAMEVLRQLDVLSPKELDALSPFVSPVPNRNNHGRTVGEIRSVFTLKGASKKSCAPASRAPGGAEHK